MDPGQKETPQRIAVVVVHGVTPHTRYQLQDQFAARFCAQLSASEGGSSWTQAVYFPWVGPVADAAKEARPTFTRVHRSVDDPAAPQFDVYDVIEAYWSPLDKGKATPQGVIRWLLTTIFVPLNSSARLFASFAKTAFDASFVGIAIALALFALAVCAWAALSAFAQTIVVAGETSPQGGTVQTLVGVLTSPLQIASVFHGGALVLLAAGAVGGYLAAQALKGAYSTVRWLLAARRDTGAKSDAVQVIFRWASVAAIAALGAGLLAICAFWPFEGARRLGFVAVLLVISAEALEFGLWILSSFLVAFFGDVQIYTTRDENSSFFASREAILELVEATILGAIAGGSRSPQAPGDEGAPYDRVIVAAHSLGSTIALDALLRIHALKEEGAVAEDDWRRIRAFVSFGSPLEKTKYFFDVRTASFSAAYEQWRDDLYGALFTADPSALLATDLRAGIFWANYWYFADPIANELESYRSFLSPRSDVWNAAKIRSSIATFAAAQRAAGARGVFVPESVVYNQRGERAIAPWHPVVHGDYLDDPWFWESSEGSAGYHLGVLGILIAHCRPDDVRRAGGTGLREARAASGVDAEARYTVEPGRRSRGVALTDVI